MTDNKTEQQPSFEQTLAELETLVEQLESGELELADSLEKFKRGIELSRQCRVMLDKAQQTVDEVMDSEARNPGDNERSSETSD
ncbi:MAG: exodeoxyribonuclease VII small subunit [Wenzhouxiangellaceae bacterium]